MGCIVGTHEEIEAIRFSDFPTKPHLIEKAIRIDNVIYAKLANGKMATSRDKFHKFAHLANKDRRLNDVVEAALKLGFISKTARDFYWNETKKRMEAEYRKYDIKRFRESCANLGIKLTAAQEKILG